MLLSGCLFDFEWTYAILTPVKSSKLVIAFLHNVAQRCDLYSPMWNFMENLMVLSTWLHLAGQKSFIRKTPKKSKKSRIFQNIRKKLVGFDRLDEFYHLGQSKKWYIRVFQISKNPRNSIYPYPIIVSIWYGKPGIHGQW